MSRHRKLSTLTVLAVLVALSGCAGSNSYKEAEHQAEQEHPCDFGPSAASKCEEQKNHEAKEKEVNAEVEAIREGKRLKEEGK